jgi:hypothetical protein
LTYSIPKIRTNYGKFNIRFSSVKVWNEIDDEIKKLKPSKFKAEVKKFLLQKYKELLSKIENTKLIIIHAIIIVLKFVRSLQPGISVMFRSLLWFK